MTLTPAEYFKLSRKIGTDTGANDWVRASLAQQKAEDDYRAKYQEAFKKLLVDTQAKQPDTGGVWNVIKHAGGKALGGALTGLDYLRAAGQSTVAEIGDASASLPWGKGVNVNENPAPGELRNTGVNFSDILYNTRHRVSPDAILQNVAPGADGWAAQALNVENSIAQDPTTYLTAGVGRQAKEAATAVEKVAGVDVANLLRRGDVEGADALLRRTAEQQTAERLGEHAARQAGTWRDLAVPAAVEPTTVADILRSSIHTGAVANPEEVLAQRLGSFNKGGLGFAGVRTGIGQDLATGALDSLRASGTGSAVRNLFVPTAKVADTLGAGAAETVDSALHVGADARRAARVEIERNPELKVQLAEAVANGDGIAPEIARRAKTAMADDIAKQMPSLVADTAKKGYKELVDGVFVPDAVHDVLSKGWSTPSSDLAKAYDSAIGWAKSQITLNPVLNPTGVPRNMFGNILFAAMGGVTDPRQWVEAGRLRSELVKFAREGGQFSEDAFKEWAAKNGSKLTERELTRASLMHEAGLAGRGSHLVDDVSEAAARGESKGTKLYSKALNWHEETARSAVFLRGIDDGLDTAQAAKRAAHYMLDYESAALTPFERDKLQRVVLFYKFPRRVLPMAAEFVATRPGEASALTKAGLGVAVGDRNQYGDKIGTYFDTPLEAAYGQLASIFADKDGPIAGAANDLGAPWVQFLLNDKKRGIEDLIPALGAANRVANGTSANPNEDGALGAAKGVLDRFLTVPGEKQGVDYELQRAEADLAQYAAKAQALGEPLKPLDAIRIFADNEGIPRAATLDAPTIVGLLLDKGVPNDVIGQILVGPPKVGSGASASPGIDFNSLLYSPPTP